MTTSKDLKRRIRERQAATGESYSTARMMVMGAQMEVRAPAAAEPARHEAIVLKVNQESARVRILGEDGQVTFRSRDLDGVEPIVPGHVVTLLVDKRWLWHGDAYASGRVETARIDIPRLGLVPLPLTDGALDDPREGVEPFRGRSAFTTLWKKLTATPRPSYEFDPIAWGQLPGRDPDDNPTCDAADLRSVGRFAEARALLMDTLALDLRVLDAHAGLGTAELDRSPARAGLHYAIGVAIGELSLPAGFDGLLAWGRLYNRPFLRCLHGLGLCQWRLGDFDAARATFERILSFNPNDNQGVRFSWEDVRRGRSWAEARERDERPVLS